MPEITKSVGDGGSNTKHDVTLVEALLRLVKNAKNVPYYGGTWDGIHGNGLKTAITNFQTDSKLITPPPPPGKTAPPSLGEKAGLVEVNSKTFKALVAALTAKHANKYDNLRALTDTKVVYLAATEAERAETVIKLTQGFYDDGGKKVAAELEPTFRQQVIDVVNAVFQEHKIVLYGWGPKSFRRSFADQHAVLAAGTSKAHPGESNHQWGRAIDFGYKGVKLVNQDGTFLTITNENVIDNQVAGWQRETLYKARNKIAEHAPQGTGALFRIRFTENGKLVDNDPNHYQAFNQFATLYPSVPTKSMSKSFAAQLTNVGAHLDKTALKTEKLEPPAAMKWEAVASHHYKSDLGFGGKLQDVGTADAIWLGTATVTKGMIAGALTHAAQAADPKAAPVKEASITAGQVAKMREALKATFVLADQKWADWQPL